MNLKPRTLLLSGRFHNMVLSYSVSDSDKGIIVGFSVNDARAAARTQSTGQEAMILILIFSLSLSCVAPVIAKQYSRVCVPIA